MKKATPRERRLLRKTQKRRHASDAPVIVHAERLAPDGSYGVPDFVRRGTYVDQPFTCGDCGVAEIWHATQQQWWYEVAKGGVWTTATRCRACRRRERERRAQARKVRLEGVSARRQ